MYNKLKIAERKEEKEMKVKGFLKLLLILI